MSFWFRSPSIPELWRDFTPAFCLTSLYLSLRKLAASRLPRSWSASLFSHMQIVGFRMRRLISLFLWRYRNGVWAQCENWKLLFASKSGHSVRMKSRRCEWLLLLPIAGLWSFSRCYSYRNYTDKRCYTGELVVQTYNVQWKRTTLPIFVIVGYINLCAHVMFTYAILVE